MKSILLACFTALTLCFFWGCQMPNDGVPFYLAIDSLVLTTDPTTQGENTQNITDVWVEANASNLGAYGLPCNFPVLLENDVRFIVSAGIKESGQSGIRIIYPFYQPDTFTLNAQREGRYTHVPQFRYKAGAFFPFLENFTFGSKFDSKMEKVNDGPNGDACGRITAIADSAVVAIQSGSVDLHEGQEIWLELDYKCDVPFFVGYFANYSTGTTRTNVLFLTEKADWNKVYIKYSNFVGASQANTYSLFFEALRPYGSSGGHVWIDNVKLVEF